MKDFTKYKLLIIDEIGYLPFDEEGANCLFHLKQFVLSLIINQHEMPLFMNAHSGKASDKKTILNNTSLK